MRSSLLLGSIASFLSVVSGHTWVEQLMNVDNNGSYYGAPGYIRSYVSRDNPNFADSDLTWLSPQNPPGGSRLRINGSDFLCHPNQRQAVASKQFHPLKTLPGNTVALRYLENGHVTQPYIQPGKPASGGLVYIYATTNPNPNTKLVDVLQWGTNSTLDQGRLLNINPFDDGRCYQVSNVPISVQRQAEFPNPIQGQPGVNHELWCQSNVKIPEDATGTLTMYWIWQWPTQANVDPGLPDGKDEIYTSCMDMTIVKNSGVLKNAIGGTSLGAFEDNTPALKNFRQRLANTTFPNDPIYYSPGSSFSSGGASLSSVASTGTQSDVPAQTGHAQQPASNSLNTLQTLPSTTTARSTVASVPGVVYVTRTRIAVSTTTVYDNSPTGVLKRRSAKFRR
ncbi:uncharacterized protein PV09_08717 [Verruconis gallopava]|uniref:DUF7492 domain-containing protein n=1 Tax=Verruconis gallopava TaxID=253628 RepID=A0A0D1ZZ07_9PEZI|nr:uncharacterized protein PV09_08717 [Verruconis gallopava]KIV99662.1 hypothetical protein PV09_08717 [Verruconis gallopava]